MWPASSPARDPPIGLAFDAAGNLYVTNSLSDTIERFTPGGVGSVFAASGLDHPAGLAFDVAGNLYVANDGGSNKIEKFTPAGVGSVFATGVTGQGLAFDSAGNLYGTNNDTIVRFTPGGVGSVFASTGLRDPFGLAFDSAGNLYATNNGTEDIERFTPGGVGSVFASNLAGPVGLAFSSAVPEPSTLVLMVLGSMSLVGYRLLRRGGVLTSS